MQGWYECIVRLFGIMLHRLHKRTWASRWSLGCTLLKTKPSGKHNPVTIKNGKLTKHKSCAKILHRAHQTRICHTTTESRLLAPKLVLAPAIMPLPPSQLRGREAMHGFHALCSEFAISNWNKDTCSVWLDTMPMTKNFSDIGQSTILKQRRHVAAFG